MWLSVPSEAVPDQSVGACGSATILGGAVSMEAEAYPQEGQPGEQYGHGQHVSPCPDGVGGL